jgi:hypothetical protein
MIYQQEYTIIRYKKRFLYLFPLYFNEYTYYKHSQKSYLFILV